MRLIDLPSPGTFAGSATLRKDLVRAISFAQTAFVRTNGERTPELAKTLKICLDHALGEIAKLEVPENPSEGFEVSGTNSTTTEEGSESHVEPDQCNPATVVPGDGSEAPVEPHVEPDAVQEVVSPEVEQAVVEVPETPLPSILRKRKN